MTAAGVGAFSCRRWAPSGLLALSVSLAAIDLRTMCHAELYTQVYMCAWSTLAVGMQDGPDSVKVSGQQAQKSTTQTSTPPPWYRGFSSFPRGLYLLFIANIVLYAVSEQSDGISDDVSRLV